MRWVILLGLLAVAAILAWSPRAREEAVEWARDLSDQLLILALRATSGFADEAPVHVLQEERQRRLRWRRPPSVRDGAE